MSQSNVRGVVTPLEVTSFSGHYGYKTDKCSRLRRAASTGTWLLSIKFDNLIVIPNFGMTAGMRNAASRKSLTDTGNDIPGHQ